MKELAKAGPWKAIPWGLVGMLCLMALAERFVARQGFYVLDVLDWGYVRKSYVATCEAKKYDVLVFGDSLNQYGVVPRAVAERSGRSVYNLSVAASQAQASYALLKRALGSGARPSAVVVDFYPPLLALRGRHNLTHWSSLLTVREAAELAWRADPDLFGTVAAGVLIPSIRAREGLRDNLVAGLKGELDWRPSMNVVAFRNWTRNDGAQVMKPEPKNQTQTDAELDFIRVSNFHPKSWQPENVAGVRAFLALAAEHGVRVYWVLPPIMPRFQAMLVKSGFDAEHEAFVRSWQARFPGLVVVDGRGSVVDPGAYHDQTHLGAPGAYAYSLALGDALRRTLPPGNRGLGPDRWVKLPSCAIGPVPEGLELMEESRSAIMAGIAKARR